MLTKEPGWYPDPQGASQVRFWDGDDWTDYTQPFAPEVEAGHGTATALEDYPYLASANLRAADGPRTVSTWTVAPVLAPTPAQAPGHRRSGLVWWLVGAGIVVVAIIAVAVNALSGGGSGSADPGTTPAPSSTATIDPVEVGTSATGTVPEDGELRTVLEVAQEGDYLVTATSSQDVRLTLTPTGTTDALPLPDDRGTALAARIGGSWADPGYWLHLPAGSYDVVVTEHDGLATDVTLLAEAAEVVDVAVGAPVDVTLASGEIAVLKIPVDAAGTLLVDARGSDAALDGQLTYDGGNRVVTVDDRGPTVADAVGGTEYDPYVEVPAEPGFAFVVLEDLYDVAGTFTVAVSLG